MRIKPAGGQKGIVDTERPVDFIESLNHEVFVGEKKAMPVVYLPGVGRFCEVCGKKLQPKTMLKRIHGKIVRCRLPVPKSQKVCNKKCRNKKWRKPNQHNTGKHIVAGINLEVMIDKSGYYRELRLYPGKRDVKIIRITPAMKDLWGYLEVVSRYRFIGKKQIMEVKEVVTAV